MSDSKYNVSDVLESLRPKSDFLGVHEGRLHIRHPHRNSKYQGDLGNKSQGKIDFLKRKGYPVVYLTAEDEERFQKRSR